MKGKKNKIKKRKDKIKELKKELQKIVDPEVGVNIVDMGLIKDLKKIGKDEVEITFVPTTPFCPIVNFFILEIEKAAKKVGLKCKVKVGE